MPRRNTQVWALTLALALSLGGCATVIAGKRQLWQFESQPTGARVLVDGRPVGITPVAVQLRRDRAHMIRFDRGGCQPRVIHLRRRVNGWFWFNLLWGLEGAIGMIVDAATGAMYELMPTAGSWSQGMMLHEGGDRMYLRVPLARQCRLPAPVVPPAPPTPPPGAPPPAAPPPPAANPTTSLHPGCATVAGARHVCRGFTPVAVTSRKTAGGRHVATRR